VQSELQERPDPRAGVDAPLDTLADVIAAQERLVYNLTAATTAQRAILKQLYRRMGRSGRPDALGLKHQLKAESVYGAEILGEMEWDIEACLLGPFKVRYRGHEMVPSPSRRAASLFKFLLVHYDRPIRREILMDTFWPDSSAKSARNNLNVTIYQLRAQFRLQEAVCSLIIYNAGSYRINPELRCWTDVAHYERLVERGRRATDVAQSLVAVDCYQEARSLYVGPMLEDEMTGEWYLDAQRRLHLEHCALLEHLCALLLDSGEIEEAITVGNELTEADPCWEVGHRLLMRAYAALEQPQLIARQFKRCEAAMRRELSVDPAAATVALFRDLLSPRLC
jgi:DNA-binding SARP family transcriptional activator